MVDISGDQEVVALLPHRQGQRLLLASNDGRGFIVDSDQVIAQTREGKQVLAPGDGAKAMICV